MADRRDFLKGTLAALGGAAVVHVVPAIADGGCPLPAGIVYTRENPGQWASKVDGHVPQVSVSGDQVTITTDHSMSEAHFIVRHTIVAENGDVLGATVFRPTDKDAVSTYTIKPGMGKLYATSFCNKHDLWVAEFSV